MASGLKILRSLRVLVAACVFCAVTLLFLDAYHALPALQAAANTQFAPSLLKMLSLTSVFAGAAFVTFVILAFFFGRVYCSFFCVFGILMDALRRAALLPCGLKFLKNTRLGKFCLRRFAGLKFARAHNALRAFVLGLAALFIALGYAGLFGFIEPYSLYGKIVGAGAYPVLVSALNGASEALYAYEIYALPPASSETVLSLPSFGVSLILLCALFAASALRGRIFCNTLCPVGALLGAISKFSVFTLKINEDDCVSCGQCAKKCKAQCIDYKRHSIDFTRCVVCLDCVGACKKDGIEFALNPIYARIFARADYAEPTCVGRRNFSKDALFLPILGLAGASSHKQSAKDANASPYQATGGRADKRFASPPCSGSLDSFFAHCTGCLLCTTACKGNVLKPSISQWGLEGFLQPFMDFKAGFCLYTCNECSEVCPSGAIQPLALALKQRIKIGTAIFDENLCVVKTDGTDCAACGEHCPVQAIEMLPYGKKEQSLYIPHVHADVCVGCGACEYICPVTPHKAIVVQGLKTHGEAAIFKESMRLRGRNELLPAGSKTPQKPSQDTNPFPF